MKEVKDKQNVGVIGRIIIQTPAPRPTYEQRCVCMLFEGVTTKSLANSYSSRWSTKKTCKWE
jgi:hypothetical protein